MRQLRKIRQLLPTVVNRISKDHVIKVCTFDNCKGDITRCTTWLLVQDDWPVLNAVPQDGLSAGHRMYVTREGRISKVYQRGQPYVKAFVLPSAQENRFILKYATKDVQERDLIPGLKDGTEFVISIDKSEFITDDQLKSDPTLKMPLDLEMNPPKSRSD